MVPPSSGLTTECELKLQRRHSVVPAARVWLVLKLIPNTTCSANTPWFPARAESMQLIEWQYRLSPAPRSRNGLSCAVMLSQYM